MNDEQAFLDALKATPADDTTRLVYADWLDERGEPAKAEYLRLVVGLVPHYAAAAPDPPEAARVQALAEQLSREWRADAAARFGVVFYGCEASHKIQTIKIVRELTGYGLAEAKRFVESPPARMPMRVSLEHAIGLRDRFGGLPTVRVAVHPDELNELPRLCFYRIYAYLAVWDRWENPDWVLPDAAIAAFQSFLTALTGMAPERTAELARGDNSVMIADSLEPSQLTKQMAELQAMLPPPDEAREWDIELYAAYQVIPPPTQP